MEFGDHWFNRYIALFGANYPMAGAVAALVLFVSGLLVASTIHFAGDYVRTIPVYLGVFGIAWVTAWAGWCSRQVPRLIDAIQPAFAIHGPEYKKIAEGWKRRIFDARFQLLVAAPPVVLVVLITIAVSGQLHFNSLSPGEWFRSPSLWGKVLILWIYTIPVGILIASCGLAMLTFCMFVLVMSRKPLVPLVGFVKFTLRPITDFAALCWLSWTVGVVLLVLLFRPGFNTVNIIVVVALTAVGFLMLLVPQFALYTAVRRTKELILTHGWRELLASGYEIKHPAAIASDPERLRKHEFLLSVAETKAWPNDPSNALLIMGTWLIPIATLAIQSRVHPGVP